MSSTVKQEHRNNVRIARDAKAINDYLGQREAMRLVRKDRPVLAPLVSDIATRGQVAAWMLRNIADYTNETQLVEGANCALKLPIGCMDDETHWIWDVAVNIADRTDASA